MASGRINLQANDGKVAGVVFEDGASSNVTVTIPKEGGKLAADSSVVHKTGDETIAGIKSFSDGVKVQNQNISPFSGFKNYIINGNFDIWQRGASQTSSGYGSDDRWVNVNTGSTKNHSQVACTDTERALFNASYFSRTVVTSVAGAGNECDKWQNIEDVSRLAGKTVTLSFWAKADSAKNIGIWFDQVFGSGGSAAVTLISNQLVALTTTWQKKTITVTLPSIVGKTVGLSSFTRVAFGFDNAAALVGRQSGTFDIAQVQLEEGSVATPFEQRPYGTELALCERYYEVIAGGDISGGAFNAGNLFAGLRFRTVKRAAPTMTANANGGWVGNNGIGALNNVIFGEAGIYGCRVDSTSFTGSVVQGYAYSFRNFDFRASAEL